MRPCASTTWTRTSLPATGSGSLRVFSSTRRATPSAVVSASLSAALTRATSRAATRATPPTAKPAASPTTPTSMRRARSPRRRHQPTASAAGRGEPVARPADRLQDVAAQLPAQVADVHLDGVRGGVEGRVPDVVEQLRLRHDLARPAHQVLQDGVLAGGQGDLGAVAGHPAARRV